VWYDEIFNRRGSLAIMEKWRKKRHFSLIAGKFGYPELKSRRLVLRFVRFFATTQKSAPSVGEPSDLPSQIRRLAEVLRSIVL
jgi:hypothetical protein